MPDDVAIVGFDALMIARPASPALTTAHQPIDKVVWTAVDLIVRASQGGTLIEHHSLSPHLVVRASA